MDALQYRTVQDAGATVIALLAHIGDPRRRRSGAHPDGALASSLISHGSMTRREACGR